ncbi:hypothetical protein SDC9_123990 [bioreactor metagenome]|uniref:superoxide dismutase n=1 Tax=bioreactor metagenome TaxID=1076179 RepID=A0A645CJ67_9ZZZZ
MNYWLKKLKVTFIESASAGYLAYRFSLTPFSGKILIGGLVCYDLKVKEKILKISPKLIAKYTPESIEITEELVKKAKNMFSSDIYVGCTGLLKPGGSEGPSGKLAIAIEETFSSIENFKAEFEKAGLGRFGSGYAWLCVNPHKKLVVHSTANQDCPLQENMAPVLVIDVWEHAYYLNYQNRRADYLSAFWKLVDWQEAERRYSAVV